MIRDGRRPQNRQPAVRGIRPWLRRDQPCFAKQDGRACRRVGRTLDRQGCLRGLFARTRVLRGPHARQGRLARPTAEWEPASCSRFPRVGSFACEMALDRTLAWAKVLGSRARMIPEAVREVAGRIWHPRRINLEAEWAEAQQQAGTIISAIRCTSTTASVASERKANAALA